MSDVSPTPAVWPAVRAALAKFSRPFPAEALALADAHREEVVPHLVAELESLAANPEQVDADDMLLDYAMHLLAWWREPRGLEPLLALASLRNHEHVDALFDDLLADGLGACLGSMARGHLQPLMALADDPHAEPYARGAALDAMKACVIEGDAPREAVLAYVRELAERVAAEGRARDDEFLVLSFVVGLAADLGATDMLPAIRGWYDEGLLDPFLAGLPDIEQVILQPPEQRLQDLREQGAGYVRDPFTEMAGWYCFREPPNPSPAWPEVQVTNPPPPRPAVVSRPPPIQTHVRESPKLGRNDPCHCGSGKKFKKCHGAT